MTEQDKGRWAPAPGYASWRAIAEVKLAKMERRHADLRYELNLLDDDIYELLRIAGNGAVGGTAWKLHNSMFGPKLPDQWAVLVDPTVSWGHS
jgi:hypothetical protein